MTRLAFAFSTRGREWLGFGRELFQSERAYRDSFAKSSEQVRARLGVSLEHELFLPAGEYRLHRAEELREPALVAHQLALCALWSSLGIRPAAVLGVGSGELAAAHAAGCLSEEDAVRIACTVGSLLRAGYAQGRHAVLHADVREVGRRIGAVDVDLAADFGAAVAIGGDGPALMLALRRAVAAGTYVYLLPTRSALHTRQLEPARAEFERSLRDPPLAARPPAIPFHAASLGGPLPATAPDVAHWWRVLRGTAHCARAVSSAIAGGCDVFVELGYGAALARVIEGVASAQQRPVQALATVRRDAPARAALFAALERLIASGAATVSRSD